ncbi:MAG: zinc-binding alcohol dehydrogenase [Candidatus Marinimicrobia bacterium]|nr:zinc-binding alcohol dehydrogenase [Candidatus Neomarinimicrobiota bacterium]MCF7828797.1 zinc-binding alcohol dehydrogenase [Candidatus Neomarinimicrobiota bacterium]MCF7880714.1 zinc-binding alcohol dehydrogenase [Candidatus Neomarinimicrobiota bacterium]
MSRHSLYFTGERSVTIREETLPDLPPDQVLVTSIYSAISAGTEMLVYRQKVPADMDVDSQLAVLPGQFKYPLKYGYAVVGKITETGSEINPDLQGKLVHAFHPHESHFHADPDDLLLLPESLEPEEALFLPNTETALNLVMDGAPIAGETVVVTGQGIVGLLTTGVLEQFPMLKIYTLDHFQLRRNASLQFGATQSFDTDSNSMDTLRELLFPEDEISGADLLYEVSGNPKALDSLLELAGFGSRIVVGSWYGTKAVSLDLGGRFHRNRVKIISSQVSTLGTQFADRWTKQRRLNLAMRQLKQLPLQSCITHRFAFENAADAYQLIDQHPEKTIQVILTY